MNPLNSYLCQQLDGLLAKHRLVVFYQPRSKHLPIFKERPLKLHWEGELQR